MAECPNENELLAWIGGRLSDDRIRSLDDHVDGCAPCRDLLGQALRTSGESTRAARGREHTFGDGEIVAGRYEVVRFLARGGMGEVYEVHDRWLKDTVALKTLLAPLADDASALARLKAEVLLARRLAHPNVCRVYDFGLHPIDRAGAREQIAFLTMELLRGETLKARIRRSGRLDTADARPIALQLLAGMAHAHRAGVVHRDFKSDNVMLVAPSTTSESRAVVMDFGLARSSLVMLSQPLTSSTHGAVGTLDYMAPEQLEGRPATQQSDLYALGVVLYEMLVGELPFAGDYPIARALRRVRSAAPRLSEHVPGLDPDWVVIVGKCLARNPDARFRSADEVTRLLVDGRQQARRWSWSARRLGISAGVVGAVSAIAWLAAPERTALPPRVAIERALPAEHRAPAIMPASRSPGAATPTPAPQASTAMLAPTASRAAKTDRRPPVLSVRPARSAAMALGSAPAARSETVAESDRKPAAGDGLLDPFSER